MYTYMISGHRNLTDREFFSHYVPLLDKLLAAKKAGRDHKVVVGDAPGVDLMAQKYLVANGFDKQSITVYSTGVIARNIVPGVKQKWGYGTYTQRDHAMTLASDYDIAYVAQGRFDSGTARNISRRTRLK